MLQHYRHPFRFYAYSAVIPWSLWLIAAYFSRLPDAAHYAPLVSVLGLAGLCGPLAVAAYYVGKNPLLRGDVTGRLFAMGKSKRKYLIASLVLMPVSIILAMAISLPFGYDVQQFAVRGPSFTSGVLPVWFILTIAPLLEELAWHSYGTDSLRQRYSLFSTSMIFAVYWALWHLPLALINGYYHSNLVTEGVWHGINFLVSIFPFVLLMNWLYYRANRNILIAVSIHLCANVFNELFATHPDSKLIQTGLLLTLCIVVIVRNRRMFFAHATEEASVSAYENSQRTPAV